MDYLSSFFRATQSVLEMSRQQDPKLIQLFMGSVGVPDNMPVDPVQLKTQLAEFSTRELKRGPLRREDVLKVARMVRYQERAKGKLNLYDADTGTIWAWDGSPIVLVVVCELACEAAVQLNDHGLYTDCACLLWGALKSIEAMDDPRLEGVRPLISAQAEAIARRFDVNAILETFDAGLPKLKDSYS